MKRQMGVLMNISSLPSEFGIGCFSRDADRFIEILKDMGCSSWQVLPITMIGAGNSPYSGLSSYAGNKLYISPIELMRDGLISEQELDGFKYYGQPYSVDYNFAYENSDKYLWLAYSRIDDKLKKEIDAFAKENEWLKDYAVFMHIAKYNTTNWNTWSKGLREHSEPAIKKYYEANKYDIEFYFFEQFEFFKQWKRIKDQANIRGIKIIGDLPYYVATDSVDVWANQSQFKLNKTKGVPVFVSGVPGDAFVKDGQVWGTVVYDIKAMQEREFDFWRNRVKHSFKMYDVLRIDHARALYNYYEIPYGDKTAENGKWVKGPGKALVDYLIKDNKGKEIILEDLGNLDEQCRKFLDNTNLPTMRIFQFAFDGTNNPHIPHNYIHNCIAYTGTHDNTTILDWLYSQNEGTRTFALKYCGFVGSGWGAGGRDCQSNKAIIKTLVQSAADVVIIPTQDLLGYGGDTRMNIPGVPEENWKFRVAYDQMNSIDTEFYQDINNTYGRIIY